MEPKEFLAEMFPVKKKRNLRANRCGATDDQQRKTNNKKPNKQPIFIENWKITNQITFPPANSL